MNDLPAVVIVDVDGTVASHKSIRGHHEYDRVAEDEPVAAIIRLVQMLANEYGIILISGRPKSSRAATETWLRDQKVPFQKLLMRSTNDNRSDEIVKRELFEEQVLGQFRIELVLDDRDRVVRMWRSLGLVCLQVADGNF